MPLAGRHVDREARIRRCGERLLAAAAHHAAATRSGWLDTLVERAIRDRAFRTQVLRFVDVLPVLQDDPALVAHLQEYFSAVQLPWPALSRWSLHHSDAPWALPVAAPLVRATLRGMARRFMGGANLRQALRTSARLRAQGMRGSFDRLGEAVLSEHEADGYRQACLDLLAGLHRHGDTEAEVSLKLSSLSARIHPADPDGSSAAIGARLWPLLTAARAQGTAVTIDMEQYEMCHIVLRCFRELLMAEPLRDWSQAGIALQAYATDAREQVGSMIDWAATRGTPVKIRLVRGAYWDAETVLAHQHGWPSPVWGHKAQTDACFEDCLERLFAQHERVFPAVATHNVRSLACAMALAEDYGLGSNAFEFQMLYGMADDLKQALVSLGYPLRVYVPYGEILPGMAYLVRRLLENTSGQTILDTGMGRVVRSAGALAPPEPVSPRQPRGTVDGFRNAPTHRFTGQEERAAFGAALAAVQAETGREYALVIDNEACAGSNFITSLNPAHPAQVIGRVASAGRTQAERALAAARAAFPGWSARPAAERAAYLRRLADLLGAQRDRFAAWQVLEAGKHWCEADADVCEAIDFLHYYAWQAEQLAAGTVLEISGEHNSWQYRPRGVGLVLAPWNFPLAILTGMLAATIVTGNTAIVKPSSLTPVVAARLMELVLQAELPAGVVNFLPGPGAQTGAWLAAHPEVATIAFTGSREVGTQLLQAAMRFTPDQRCIKRVIAELGGKNAIIVDDDADLDAAVPGVLQSAFGYQGQKCSAASRVITVGRIHAPFVERLCAAVDSLRIGDPVDPGNLLGPVIDAAAQRRISTLVAQARRRAELRSAARTDLPEEGWYLAPAVFTGVAADDSLAQEEIFGPLLAVLHAENFAEAIALANGTSYALTGGVYSRSPAHLALARDTLLAGNLYFNRCITGALVGRQPFGGFRLSGTGSKAGGPDYLKQFLDPVCITENTLRRGFAPDTGEAP